MKRDDDDRSADENPPRSPHGPQHGRVDEAAGGVDSSPFENVPSDERKEASRRPPNQNPSQREADDQENRR